jgi:NhaP-type Na+/H+ or K+/H+ antiporter
VLSAFILVFGLFSFLIKERLFLSDSLVAMLWGIAGTTFIFLILVGPRGLNVMDPTNWGTSDQLLVFYFSDLVINVQIMAAAIALPRRFWKSRFKSLCILLGPVTIYMWMSTAVVFHFFFDLPWYPALLLASTCAPTDPVLANSIVNGRFAELHINRRVRDLLSGESAANDGAVLPFFELAIFLLLFPTIEEAFTKWSYFTLVYQLMGSILLGLGIGLAAAYSLRYAEENNLIDKSSFLGLLIFY